MLENVAFETLLRNLEHKLRYECHRVLPILCRFHRKFATIGIDCAILSQAGGRFEWQGRLAIVGTLLALTFATFRSLGTFVHISPR